MQWLTQRWYRRSLTSTLLWPLSQLYRGIISVRRLAYRVGMLTTTKLPVPVIIVGNINVGGTGKSPFVIWLAQQLREAGYSPGIISRGYGGKGPFPYAVDNNSRAGDCGDEPLMIYQRSQCPVVVDPNRVAAGQYLLEAYQCDVIIADDGLQHYRLGRDIEIVLIDGDRQFGNGFLLPAGPLRESVNRLKTVDFLICNGRTYPEAITMQLQPGPLMNLQSGEQIPLTALSGQTVNAVAGIGHPERFFRSLRAAGLTLNTHAFADHHSYRQDDLSFADSTPILMTEKDAVKCRSFATDNMWYLPVEAELPSRLAQNICEKLRKLKHG